MTSVMASGEDPTYFFAMADDTRLSLQDMGKPSYDDIVLCTLSKGYDFARLYHEDRTCDLTAIRTTVTNAFIDELPRKSSAKSVSG